MVLTMGPAWNGGHPTRQLAIIPYLFRVYGLNSPQYMVVRERISVTLGEG
jgi:hypothetical protein